MCFDNLIKFYVSHYYSKNYNIISIHIYLYKHILSDMDIYLSFTKKYNTFKTYIFIKLSKKDEAKDERTQKHLIK